MPTNSQIIARFVEQAGKPDARMLSTNNSNLDVSSDTLYSYGRHFPMAIVRPSADGNPRGWWLVNGDSYSVTTSHHQSILRGELTRVKDMPQMIVSFDAMGKAGIVRSTVQPVDILPDRYTWEPRVRDKEPSEWERDSSYARNWQQREDGKWSYDARVHHLGESLFTASYRYDVREPGYYDFETHTRMPSNYTTHKGTAYFLSAFDENERDFGLYFLAQLPDGAHPQTVAEAKEALKPNLVKAAEMSGREVLRQGDVFAIPHPQLETKQLPGPSERSAFVLEVNHQVTEVRKDNSGATYGRGIMRHRPRESWRRPEHRQLILGDRKTWFELVRNTVPEGRSWSRQGNVD